MRHEKDDEGLFGGILNEVLDSAARKPGVGKIIGIGLTVYASIIAAFALTINEGSSAKSSEVTGNKVQAPSSSQK